MTNKLLFLGTGGVSDAVRLVLPSKEISAQTGTDVIIRRLSEADQRHNLANVARIPLDDISAVLFSRPASPDIVSYLKDKGLYVIIDMDDDFHSIPHHHPGYKWVGPGNPRYLRTIEQCVSLADHLTVTTPELKERWKDFAKEITIIPNGWSKDNPFWRKTYKRNTINLGWGGTITHRLDFQLALPALVRAAKEKSFIKIVIAGDPHIYLKLKKVPEHQKMFVPSVQYMDWVHTLCYFDILLAPLEGDAFNTAKSDIKLVDAGAMGIPWIASPVREYISWRDGGIFAETEDEWHDAIMRLIDPIERTKIGQWGYQRAQMREMAFLVETLWKEVLL